MALSQKSQSKTPASIKSARGAGAKIMSDVHAVAPSKAAVKKFALKNPPLGVKVVVTAAGAAAKKTLKHAATGWTKPARPTRASETGEVKVSIEPSAYAPNARARALLQGLKIAEADLKEAGGAFEPGEVQLLLSGISRQALEKRVKDGSLLAVPGPSNRRRYPVMQFTGEGVVPGLKKVQEALPTRNPWAILNFLVRSDNRLGGRKPIEVLREGDVDRVVSAARGMGVQGG